MTLQRVPHPLNISGDFYVEDNCCLMCDIPRTVAPDLFGVEGDDAHCFVKHQPSNDSELVKMLNAIRTAELQCIRYRGSSRAIQIRLVESGDGAVCDDLPIDLASRAIALEREEAKKRRGG